MASPRTYMVFHHTRMVPYRIKIDVGYEDPRDDADGENAKVGEDENAEVGEDEEYMGVEIIEFDTKEEGDGP